MGPSERYSAGRSEETPEEVEVTVYDNGGASRGTFLLTEYWSSCAF